MATIETIGSTGDYSTPQAWYDAHSGDITSDVGAPYIGELAAESFSGIQMATSITDATHYFHLRSQTGAEFKGDFDAGNYAVINSSLSLKMVDIQDDYCKIEGFSVENKTLSGGLDGIYVINSINVLIDSIGIYNLTTSGSAPIVVTTAGIHANNATNISIRNCAIGKLSASNNKFGESDLAIGIFLEFCTNSYTYNNAIESVVGIDEARGISVNSATAVIVNNIIGNISGSATYGVFDSSGLANVRNNATTDTTGGVDSQDNITPSNEFLDTILATLDLHIQSGGQCESNGLNLIANSYPNAPTTDIDGELITTTGVWNIGADQSSAIPPVPSIPEYNTNINLSLQITLRESLQLSIK